MIDSENPSSDLGVLQWDIIYTETTHFLCSLTTFEITFLICCEVNINLVLLLTPFFQDILLQLFHIFFYHDQCTYVFPQPVFGWKSWKPILENKRTREVFQICCTEHWIVCNRLHKRNIDLNTVNSNCPIGMYFLIHPLAQGPWDRLIMR